MVNTERCASLGEPSLLLRFLGDQSPVLRLANYRESNLKLAKKDLREQISDFDTIYDSHVHTLMSELYERIADGKPNVIDKTPRYTLIAKEIQQVFPEAYFIVLWRHPLAMLASVVQSMCRGEWWFDDFLVDLEIGAREMFEFTQINKDSDQLHILKFEDFLTDPLSHIQNIGKFINDASMAEASELDYQNYDTSILGDPSRGNYQNGANLKRSGAWQSCYDNWYRHRTAKKIFELHKDIYKELDYEFLLKTPLITPASAFRGLRDLKHFHYKKRKQNKTLRKKIERNGKSLR